MDPALKDIISRIPDWKDAKDLQVCPARGLTNKNYLVSVNGEKFILRIGGKNSAKLGIDRQLELEALQVAASAGIGPEIVRYFLPDGHLVTRLIDGRHWETEEYRQPENLRRMVETVKRVHALPAIKATFSPFRRVESFAQSARAFGVPFPDDFDIFLKKMRAVESEQARDTEPWLRFCHNDLFGVNFLDDGGVRIIDWEFAGMGDIYYDLATLVYAYDSDGPLPEELAQYLLECYFGQVNDIHRARLEGMKFMLLFFTAMWGLLQHGMQKQGLIAIPDDFDCLDYAKDTFAEMRKYLQ